MKAEDLAKLEMAGSGYRFRDLRKIMDEVEYEEFCQWMVGQTISMVDGEPVVYAWDVHNWMRPMSDRFWD